MISRPSSARGTLGTGLSYTEINNAANSLGNAILANLIVQEGPLAYFRQGVGDTKIPADVQALGAMYLQARGDGRAAQVASYLQQRFYVAPRAAAGIGTLSGFRPYSGHGRAGRDLVRGARSRPRWRWNAPT